MYSIELDVLRCDMWTGMWCCGIKVVETSRADRSLAGAWFMKSFGNQPDVSRISTIYPRRASMAASI